MDLASRQTQVLTDSNKDESPSFAPNSRMILIATEVGGRGVLSAVSSDGRIKQRLSVAAGDVREPAWGPLLSIIHNLQENFMKKLLIPALLSALILGCSSTPIPDDSGGAPVESRSGSSGTGVALRWWRVVLMPTACRAN
jgi:hypothetical protein